MKKIQKYEKFSKIRKMWTIFLGLDFFVLTSKNVDGFFVISNLCIFILEMFLLLKTFWASIFDYLNFPGIWTFCNEFSLYNFLSHIVNTIWCTFVQEMWHICVLRKMCHIIDTIVQNNANGWKISDHGRRKVQYIANSHPHSQTDFRILFIILLDTLYVKLLLCCLLIHGKYCYTNVLNTKLLISSPTSTKYNDYHMHECSLLSLNRKSFTQEQTNELSEVHENHSFLVSWSGKMIFTVQWIFFRTITSRCFF